MPVAVTYPDLEKATSTLLRNLMADLGETATVGTQVPTGWTPSSEPHLQVVWDGTPVAVAPVFMRGTVRVLARAGSPGEAKRLALLAYGLLLGPWTSDDITSIIEGPGPLPARDPETHAELCAVTVLVTVCSTPIAPGS